MLGALAAATRVLGGPGGDVVVLTDGEVFQTGPIIEHMAASQSRVHVLGIGTASQHRFMAQLARRTHGVCEMVPPSGDVGLAGLKLFNQVKEPVLHDPKVTVDGTDITNLGTVWDGLPLLVTDPKGDGSLPGSILVDGLVVPGTSFVQVKVPDGLTALLWAGRRIEDMCSKMDMVAPGTPKHDQITKAMEEVSLNYGLASRVMSLVAVVERLGDAAGTTPEQKIVAVGLPEGMGNLFGDVEVKTSGGLLRSRRIRIAATSRATKGLSFAPDDSAQSVYYSTTPTTTTLSMSDDSRGVSVNCLNTDSYRGGGARGMSLIGDFDSEAIPVAAAPACGPATQFDPDAWSFTGNLLVDLAGLKSDGGVPGAVLEDRVLHTMTLALIVSLAAKQFPGVYDMHLDKMVVFIEANGGGLHNKVAVHKVVKAIKDRTCKLDQKTLESYFYKVQKDVIGFYQAL